MADIGPDRPLLRLGVVLHAGEIDRNRRLVSDRPTVVTRRDKGHLTRVVAGIPISPFAYLGVQP